jgi:hypothetical protein
VVGLKNFKYFNIRYIDLFLNNKYFRKLIALKYSSFILKFSGIFKRQVLVRILNILKKMRLSILGIIFKPLVPFNGCKLKL